MDIVWPSFDPWWRIWGGWPDWSVIPPARPAQYEGYITRFDTFSSASYYQYRLELYCFALLGWIGLGAVASDRGRRYCVKGFGVRPLQQKPLCLSPIYIYAPTQSSRGIEAQILWQAAPASPEHIRPLFINTHLYSLHIYCNDNRQRTHFQLNKSWFWMCCTTDNVK